MVPPQKKKKPKNTCNSYAQTQRFRDESESAHQGVDEMLSRAEVFSESGLGETLLTRKAQVEVVCLSVSVDAHHHQRNACSGLDQKSGRFDFNTFEGRGDNRKPHSPMAGVFCFRLLRMNWYRPSWGFHPAAEQKKVKTESCSSYKWINRDKYFCQQHKNVFVFTGRARFCTCEGPESVFVAFVVSKHTTPESKAKIVE